MNQPHTPNRRSAGLIHATLRRFCARHDDSRKQLRQPWLCGDGVVATDGSILVFLPRTQSERYRPAYGKLLNVVERFERKYKPGSASVLMAEMQIPEYKRCKTCCSSGFVIKTPCTECVGAGHFMHGSHRYECKQCRGTGSHCRPSLVRRDAERDTCPDCNGQGILNLDLPVPVPGGFIRMRYLDMLKELKGCELFAPADPTVQAYPFRFEDGHGWVMPCNPL